MDKPRILVVTGHYLPGFRAGGPLRSVLNLVNSLGAEFEFFILTSDRDLGDSESYPDIRKGKWQDVGKARVRYLGPAERGIRDVCRAIADVEHDLLYLNSFFSPWGSIAPLVGRRLGLLSKQRILIAPRGEFSEGALALKRFKKRSYVQVARAVGILPGLFWHASSSYESGDIRRVIRARVEKVYVASNLSSPPAALGRFGDRNEDAGFHVAFLSRISPKKNLEYALDVLREVRVPVTFNIYGPAEDQGYWVRCQEKIARLPAHVSAHYHGALTPRQVPAAMRANDLFFLPTRGENFGHVIAEALGVGTPVLISDQTPWRGLRDQGLGFDFALDQREQFVEVIERFGEMPPEERTQIRLDTHAAVVKHWNDRDDVAAHREMFRRVIEAGNG
ncbi:glycosyltransferase family 4 protein [Thioalkalivibrio sp. ALMg11]|uniref:glycosyltransferase family 4 protein n=1 Tax=Thioalkalivibrio sp. ALMg11 TaxID=1158165 RepID=UPI00037797D8|nr:glycosyltransferase family 4 protein [Thioalkalivibrio sp. ALMg11]